VASAADLVVRIRTEGDTKNLDNAASSADKWGKRTAAAATALAAGSAAVIAFGSAAVKSASRTQQAMGGVDSVFGKNAGTIKKWAADSAQSVGLATSQYGEFATLLGSQLKNMGLPMAQVTQKTGDLIKLGADLAATYGGTTADAVEALSAVFRGETDPIEKYGVTIKQADINAQKAKMGASGLTGAADKQATAMAALALVTNQTAAAHGKFAEESNTAAGQAQRASAEYENMKSALGTALLPIVAAAAQMLGGLARAVGEHPRLAQAAGAAILVLTAAIFGLIVVTKIYTAVQVIMGAVSGAAWLAALGPILLVAVAVAAVIAVVVLLWKKSETFRSIVLGVWAAVRAAAVATGNAVKAVWNAVWAVLRAGASAYIAYWRAIWTAARVTATAVANAVRATWNAVWGALRSGANGVASAVKAVWSGIATAARNAGSAVRGAFASAFGALRAAAGGLGSALAAPFNALRGAINSVIGAVQSLIGWLGRIHVPKISLPKIPGLGRSAAPAVSGVSAFAAGARSYGVAPRVTSPAARATSSGGGSVVINVNGALDPEAVARQIRRLLGAHGRRTGAGTALVFR
jgi:phage-related protein